MNKTSFLSLVRQASRISDQEVEELEKLIVNFPYCQTAHLLIAKAAYDKGSMLSNQKLKKAAIYAANRQLLKKLIYTSDATVALQPVSPSQDTVKAPEVAETPVAAAPITAQAETETAIISVDAAANPESTGEKEGNPLAAENLAMAREFVAEVVATETLSEPDPKVTAEVPVLPETDPALTPGPVLTAVAAPASENPAPLETQPDHEDAAIATEILEEGYLPLAESEFLNAVSNPADAGLEISSEATLVTAPAAEQAAVTGLLPDVEIETGSESKTPQEITESAAIETFRTEVFGIEELAGDAGQALIESELVDQQTLAEEVAIAAAFNNPAAHEVVAHNPEIVQPEAALEVPETSATTPEETVLNDDLLHETLASFDQYLFKPEKEPAETLPEEDVKVVNPENEVAAIFRNDPLGYWMNSSRLGESLEFKNELTTSQPYDFHPELLWEYNKTHELPKEIKPAPSKLSHQLDIIDNFLKMTPRLKAMANAKVKTEAQEDLSLKSSKINKNLASENFANILVQQGKIKKAIKIYEHLILKIPEKKAYFVSQIEKLQNPE